jgi:DNA invertase Pin-like site-specific DNA recombinase
MRIGYARVSTEDQTLDLQKDTLKRAKCREIYEEQASGKNTGRPQLEGCLKSLREGDTLVVWRLDRLGRNLADLVRLIAELDQRKINFESLTEKIETRSPAGRLVFHVFAALAEFERNLIRERTVAGLNSARARGRKGGRPAKLSPKEIKTIRALLKTADIPCGRNRSPLRHRPINPVPRDTQTCGVMPEIESQSQYLFCSSNRWTFGLPKG